MGQWIFPLDPDCPGVIKFNRIYEDPMSEYAPMEDFWEDFQRRHRPTCGRCQQYGVDNVEVEY